MTAQHVLDSGAMLHRIFWQCGSTFDAILDTYEAMLTLFCRTLLRESSLFLDMSFSTNDMTHKHQSKGKKSVSVAFTPEMKLTVTKYEFHMAFLEPSWFLRKKKILL